MKYDLKYFLLAALSFLMDVSLGTTGIPIILLIIANIVDYFTGMVASYYTCTRIKSSKHYLGVVKKVLMYVLILVGTIIDVLINHLIISSGIDYSLPISLSLIVAVWFLLNELISITENCLKMGVEVKLLKPFIIMIRGKLESEVPKDEERKVNEEK